MGDESFNPIVFGPHPNKSVNPMVHFRYGKLDSDPRPKIDPSFIHIRNPGTIPSPPPPIHIESLTHPLQAAWLERQGEPMPQPMETGPTSPMEPAEHELEEFYSYLGLLYAFPVAFHSTKSQKMAQNNDDDRTRARFRTNC